MVTAMQGRGGAMSRCVMVMQEGSWLVLCRVEVGPCRALRAGGMESPTTTKRAQVPAHARCSMWMQYHLSRCMGSCTCAMCHGTHMQQRHGTLATDMTPTP